MSSTDRKLSRWPWIAIVAVLVALFAAYVVAYPPTWIRGPADDADAHASHDEHHDEHEHAVNVTVWTDELEIYVNHPYAVATEPFEMAVHITQLNPGTPLAQGAVTVELRGPRGVREATAEAADAGVWLVPLQLAEAGKYRTQLRVMSKDVDAGRLRFDLPPLTVYATEEEEHEAAEAVMSENATEVEFLKEQQWRIGLRTEVLRPREIAESLVFPGKVLAPHGAEAMIVPPIPGRVMPPPSGKFPQIGDPVAEGQLLSVIEPSVAGPQAVQLLVNQAQLKTLDAELAAKQLDVETKIAAAEVELELAKSDLERLQGLSGGGVVAEKRLVELRHRVRQTEATLEGLQRVQKTYAAAHARLAAFLGQIRTGGTGEEDPDSLTVPLRSPLAGTVVDAEVTAGEFVTDDHPLFRVVDMQKLNIDAGVSEYDIARVQDAPGAKFRLSTYPDRVLPIFGPGAGRLVFIGGVVDPDSRTVPVRFEVPNDENLLRVGMFAEVMIETDRRGSAMVVPERTVVDDSGEPIVYIQTGGESFERRPVQLGIRDGNDVEIRRGLKRGERVVMDGAYAIRLSTLAGGVPEHHHHH
jgi:multidrug efflux pump subunit AcrA (membrane-fusion protein)